MSCALQFEPKEKDVRKRGGGDDLHRRDDDFHRRDDDFPKKGGDDFHKRDYGNGLLCLFPSFCLSYLWLVPL